MGANRQGCPSGLCFCTGPLGPGHPSLPGVTAVPNENPAQRVFLLPNGDWGAHFQVPKGVEVGNAPRLGAASHIAKIWALSGEKRMPRVRAPNPWVREGGLSGQIGLVLGGRWSRSAAGPPQAPLSPWNAEGSLGQWASRGTGISGVPSACQLPGKPRLLTRA